MVRHLRMAPRPFALIFLIIVICIGPIGSWVTLQAAEISGPSGQGTAQDPYRIDSAEDLRWIHAALAADSLAGTFFRQVQDIDLADSPSESPIGSQSTHAFAGTYDGQGFVIRHLQLTAAGMEGTGLFSVNQGTIRRLGVVDVTISGLVNTGSGPILYVGALAGINRGIVEQCFASGQIDGGARVVGGLVGLQTEPTGDEVSLVEPRIRNSYSTVQISGSDHYYGGLVGSLHAGSIASSYASGAVDGQAGQPDLFDIFGGLVGYAYAGTRMSNVFSTGLINEGRLDRRKGGLVGYNYSQIESARTCSDAAIGSDFAANPPRLLQTGLPLEHFQQMDSFADDGWSSPGAWDFTSIWELDSTVNRGLPTLRSPWAATEPPTGETEATGSTGETEATEPDEPATPTELIESSEPGEPTDSTKPTEPATPGGAAPSPREPQPTEPVRVALTPVDALARSSREPRSQPWTGDRWRSLAWLTGIGLLSPLPFLIRRRKT